MNDAPDCALRVARALAHAGLTPLVVDTRDRLFGKAAPQSLFDWRQQLARRQLLALPLEDVTGWHAPGAHAAAAGLLDAARDYAALVFDCTPADAAATVHGAHESALLAVHPGSMQTIYALLKTRAATGGLDAILTGEPGCCAQVGEACARFLGATVAAAVSCIADENDAIAALAVRMAGEEPGCQPTYRTGNP
ncbi:MAG: hypothetical protein LDL19_05105 [Thiobacillus sp.]|nr:hypothetical protein [Thiobacillus sp.]